MDGAPAFVFCTRGVVHLKIVRQRAGPQCGTDVHVPGQCGRAAMPRNLRRSQRIGPVIRAKTAMRLRNANRQQTGSVQIAIVFRGEASFAIVARGAWRKFIRCQLLRRCDQRRLLRGQAIRCRIVDGCCIHRWMVAATPAARPVPETDVLAIRDGRTAQPGGQRLTAKYRFIGSK